MNPVLKNLAQSINRMEYLREITKSTALKAEYTKEAERLTNQFKSICERGHKNAG